MSKKFLVTISREYLVDTEENADEARRLVGLKEQGATVMGVQELDPSTHVEEVEMIDPKEGS